MNCPFYFKIGACRYGDSCSRQHNRPTASQTILLRHLYLNPLGFEGGLKLAPEVIQKSFDEFYEDVFTELAKYGEIEELHVCDNLCEHMFGRSRVLCCIPLPPAGRRSRRGEDEGNDGRWNCMHRVMRGRFRRTQTTELRQSSSSVLHA